jgi:hypothetical protein
MAINKFKLTPEKQAKLELLSTDIEDLEDEIKKARSVGIDVSKVEAQLKAAKILKENIIKVYGNQ